MIFETRVALLVREDLEVWQKLNVAAFLATGMAGAAPEAMGEPYEDAAGRPYTSLLGQPLLVFSASGTDLLRARRLAQERGLTIAAMFTTGHDAANRDAFRAEPADSPDLVGLALRGPKKDVERATKGLKLHP